MPKESPAGIWTSNLEGWSSTSRPLCYRNLQGILPSHSLSLPWLQRAGFRMGCSCENWAAAAKNHFFTLWKIAFSALLLWKSEKPGFAKKQFFTLSCLFHAALMKLRQAWALQKKIISGSKKMFFPHCSHETQKSPALQKTHFYAPFFSHASCQICQLHLVTSFKLAPNCADACNAQLRMVQGVWGTLGLLWCKFACIKK